MCIEPSTQLIELSRKGYFLANFFLILLIRLLASNSFTNENIGPFNTHIANL